MGDALDLAELRDVGRVGCDTLVARVLLLCDAIEREQKSLDDMGAHLTRVQARCTELVLENRQLKVALGASQIFRYGAIIDAFLGTASATTEPAPPPVSGILLPGFTCAACGIFTGFEKEEHTACRGCGAPRP